MSHKQKWWGYKHINGTYQTIPYFEMRDIMIANESNFCETVVGPFYAADIDEARQMVQSLVASMDTSEPTEAEMELYYCIKGTGGGFMTQLVKTIMHADIKNQNKLAMGFPQMVHVTRRYMNEPGYWEILETRVQNF
jgi:hypothetical protein